MNRQKLLERLAKLALDEDRADRDLTSVLTVDKNIKGEAVIIARERLLVSGTEIVPIVVKQLGSRGVRISKKVRDGEFVKDGDVLFQLKGPLCTLLSIERTLLNFLQRTCGVATHTNQLLCKVEGIKVLDTRKTMPGFRILDKQSVKAGGGHNHRMNLSDLIMVKNNHIDANGGDLRKTLDRLYKRKPKKVKVEVEVRDFKELAIALEYAPDIIMLDNMSDIEIKSALKQIKKSGVRTLIEASGGITPERLARLAKLGVDFVSMGRLTTQARNVDISMRIKKLSRLNHARYQ